MIEIRVDDLKNKRSGSILTEDEPRICWVPMMTRPYIANTSKGFVFAQCNTFNLMLNSTLKHFKNTNVLSLDIPVDKDLFDLTGNLANFGKSTLWKELNRQIRVLEKSLEEERI